MKVHPISRSELWMAESALFIAILLQIAVWSIKPSLTFGPQYLIIISEVVLAVILSYSSPRRHRGWHTFHRPVSILLLAILSVANISSFFLVARSLLTTGIHLTGKELLVSALAIFLTNIIVFALWYWEIDSPGLTGKRWSKNDRDFQFTQQAPGSDFRGWQPTFIDYVYLAVTNAINFAPADALPLTTQAKALMGTQALVSVFTLALVLARSVSILGQ